MTLIPRLKCAVCGSQRHPDAFREAPYPLTVSVQKMGGRASIQWHRLDLRPRDRVRVLRNHLASVRAAGERLQSELERLGADDEDLMDGLGDAFDDAFRTRLFGGGPSSL